MPKWLERFMARLRARQYGALRESLAFRETLAIARLVRGLWGGGSVAPRVESLAVAARLTSSPIVRQFISARLREWMRSPGADVWRTKQIGLERYRSSFGGIAAKGLTTSLLLKAPGPNGERGVLYSSFEYNWVRLAQTPNVREFFRHYYLVGASSWSPTDFVAFGHLAGLSTDPAFIGVSHLSDLEAYRAAAPAIQPIPLMACDWVDPEFFAPKPRDSRGIDILMVANWLRFKRHWLLFEALRRMPRALRVVLVGRNGPGRTEREIRAEARAFGIRQDLELHTNIDAGRVAALQSDARISVLFSQREGSCVAPVESMFANTPVAMMRGAHVGSIAHINPETGVLVERHGLARSLMAFLEQSGTLSPRKWAIENVSCHRSSRHLNSILRSYADRSGHPWTQDIAPLCWRYVPSYVEQRDEARLAPAVRQLGEDFAVDLVKFQHRGQ